jgi:antitoxin PrlF
MPSTTLTAKGQMVIPKEVREHLGIRPGDQVDFVLRDNGEVVVRPAAVDVRQLRGLLRRPSAKPVPVEQMQQAIRRRAAKKDA